MRGGLQQALERLGPGAMTVIDVGARWGANESWFRLKPLARLVGFEPDPEECARLNGLAEPGQEHFVPLALGRTPGPATLHLTNNPACASLYPPSAAMVERYPENLGKTMLPVGTRAVEVTTLERWAAADGLTAFEFLKLDTQGADLDILRGAGTLLDGCLGVEVEVMFAPLYDGQPLFADVDAFLRGRGFTLWRLGNLAHYAERTGPLTEHRDAAYYNSVPSAYAIGTGRLVWGNALYFRDWRGLTDQPRVTLLLAALLEAAGDLDGAAGALAASRKPASPRLTDAPPTRSRDAGLDELGLGDAATKRIRIALGGHDCDAVPKVAGAGAVFPSANGPVQLMHNGVRVVADGYQGRWMTELIRRLGGHHEPQEEKAFLEILKHVTRSGGVMVELGCYWAYYALWFWKVVPEARCFLVEPDPNYLAVGRRNFALNGAAGDFLHASVGRRPVPPRPFPCGSDRVARPVPQVAVDEYLRGRDLTEVDVLLADIQGAELDMLHGAERSLRDGVVRFLVVSTHHHAISGDPLMHQKCLALVRGWGMNVLAEHAVAESFSGDGLIVAACRPADRHLPPIPLSYNRAANGLFREVEYDLAAVRAAA